MAVSREEREQAREQWSSLRAQRDAAKADGDMGQAWNLHQESRKVMSDYRAKKAAR